MSKKVFLKRSYAEVVASDVTDEESTESTGEPGISVIRSHLRCFPWIDMNNVETRHKSASPQKRRFKAPLSLNKKRRFFFSSEVREDKECTSGKDKGSTIDQPVIITSSESDDDWDYETKAEVPLLTATKTESPHTIEDSDSSDSLPSLYNVLSDENTHDAENMNDEQFKECYENDPQLPIYKRLTDGIKTKEAVSILLENLDETNMARNIPNTITQNVSFIYSIQNIGHWKNALCDGMGRWNQKGTESTNVTVNEDGIYCENFNNCNDGTGLKVTRRKYINSSSNSLHRVVIILTNLENNETLNQMFVQYYFIGGERKINIKSHGNSSKETTSFKRSKESTKNRIKELCSKNKKTKDIFYSLIEEQGGIENITSSSNIPRNRQQVSNFRNQLKSDVGPLLECSDLAKMQENSEDRFVRDVRSAPEFSIFLATDRQLYELEKYCTNSEKFSILGVDTTFNIGQFYVTITTYRNQMLLTEKDSEPVIIGPILIHQRKTFDSYFKLTSGIVQSRPSLKNIKVFGTDGDVSLSQACEVCFTEARHLLCDIHMHDNIKRKLLALNICGPVSTRIMRDIFGTVEGPIKKPGLVDSVSTSDFDTKLNALSEDWPTLHQNGKAFLDYFLDHKAPLIKSCMIAEIRAMCGLGYPPQPYTQNANECINAVIKADIFHGKKSDKDVDPYKCVNIIHKIVKRQESEAKLALIGKGSLRLKPEYMHLKVDEDVYWKKTTKQREAAYKRILSEPLAVTNNISDEHRVGSVLSLTARNCNIKTTSHNLLEKIFEDASLIVNEETNIVAVPGTEKTEYLVLDISSKEQRQLKINTKTNRISCEKRCHRWNSLKICCHSIALAEKLGILKAFINKFTTTNQPVNVTKMVNTNMPANRGKKGVKATQIRKGKANKPQTVITRYEKQNDDEISYGAIPVKNSYVALKQSNAHETSNDKFDLTSIHGLIKKCYGCDKEFSAEDRQPPFDLILKHEEIRPRYDRDKQKWYIHHTHVKSNAYYHLNIECVKKVHNNFDWSHVHIPIAFKTSLTSAHKRVLGLAGVSTL